MFSERLVHFTGRPSSNAALATIWYSTMKPAFAPNPPPTAALTPCTWAASRPSLAASSSRTPCGPCVAAQNVNPPSGVPGVTTMPAGSIGTGRDALVDDAGAHDDVGGVEHALDGTGAHAVGDVGSLRLEHHGGAGLDPASGSTTAGSGS